jgi:hypothetical protein
LKPTQLGECLEATQARAFIVRTTDGSAIHVPHTDYIMLNEKGDQAFVLADDRKLRILDTDHISSVEFDLTKQRK